MEFVGTAAAAIWYYRHGCESIVQHSNQCATNHEYTDSDVLRGSGRRALRESSSNDRPNEFLVCNTEKRVKSDHKKKQCQLHKMAQRYSLQVNPCLRILCIMKWEYIIPKEAKYKNTALLLNSTSNSELDKKMDL